MIIRLKKNTKVKRPPFANNNFLNDRYGFWGNVTAVDSKKMKVRVRATTGFEYIGIPVCSNEWVNKQNGKFSGSRNLPPVGSRVFVFMPTGTITGAFILCSGYAEGDTDTHDLYEENKENEKKTVTVNGWTKIEDADNGLISISSENNNIKLNLIPDGDSAKIELVAFNIPITIDANGVRIDGPEKGVNLSFDKKVIVDAKSDIEIKTKGKFKVTKNGTSLLEVE